ncbi:LysR family transcriptional regulator [Ideonella sp. A 288]|uniref:LysR family transcriptional regulator n=1 Tax=Ideonella sp. A 288 TaxID=1962181 RepID=UPI001303AD23|nr:LysR substrate-binding domain-containing protein [Ideonella sp. A 288]
MKLQQLEALVAVVDSGSIRAAARMLNLSQAAISKSMRTLEQEAAVPLLVRLSRGVELTPAGHRLLARARLVTRQLELARDDLRQANDGDAGTLRIGIAPFITMISLGQAFRWFRQRYRNVEVHFIEGLMTRVLPRLRDGTLDMAAVAADVGELQGDEFVRQRLLLAPQCVLVREGHPVLAEPTARALADLEWVFTQPIAGGLQPRLDAMFALAGVAPPTRVVLTETLAGLAVLRGSDAAAVAPNLVLGLPETHGIVAVPNSPLRPGDLEVLLLTRPDVPMTPAAAYFAHCLATVVSQSKSPAALPELRARSSA